MDTVTVDLKAKLRIHHIPKRARKERIADIVHDYTVTIPVIASSDAPLAFSWKDGSEIKQRRFYGGTLWQPVTQCVDNAQKPYALEELKRDIAMGGHRPILNYKQSRLDDAESTLATLKESGSTITNDDQIKKCESYAVNEKLLIIDGEVWGEGDEPLYQTVCFGMGSNHGGTALMVSTGAGQQGPRDTCFFPADALQDAIEYTERTATNRGDSNNLPIKPHEIITVHVPEAVTVRNPNYGHGYKLDEMSPQDLLTKIEETRLVSDSDAGKVCVDYIKSKGLEDDFKQYLSQLIDDEYNAQYNR